MIAAAGAKFLVSGGSDDVVKAAPGMTAPNCESRTVRVLRECSCEVGRISIFLPVEAAGVDAPIGTQG